MSQKSFIIELRDDGRFPQPVVIRLRLALKTLLRCFGFKCLEIREANNTKESLICNSHD